MRVAELKEKEIKMLTEISTTSYVMIITTLMAGSKENLLLKLKKENAKYDFLLKEKLSLSQ